MSRSEIVPISPTALPRKTKRPKYSILHYVAILLLPLGNPKATAAAHYPENTYKYYEPIYYKAFDSIVNTIKDTFVQPTFKLFSQAENLFLKAMGKQDVTDALKVLFECDPINLEEVVTVLKSFSREKTHVGRKLCSRLTSE